MATKIYCSAVDCEYVSKRGYCVLKHIDLSDHSVMTVWEGRQRFQRCRAWQKSKEYAEMEKLVAPLIETMKNA